MANRYPPDHSEDDRLPEGMHHVGYDADEVTHHYQDQDGTYWQSEPGCRYGVLRRSGSASNDATEASAAITEQQLRKHEREAWQYLLPLLFPLAILIYFFNPLGPNSSSPDSQIGPHCAEPDSVSYVIKSGDSCWEITGERTGGVDDLLKMNPGLDCGVLKIGQMICVPVWEESPSTS